MADSADLYQSPRLTALEKAPEARARNLPGSARTGAETATGEAAHSETHEHPADGADRTRIAHGAEAETAHGSGPLDPGAQVAIDVLPAAGVRALRRLDHGYPLGALLDVYDGDCDLVVLALPPGTGCTVQAWAARHLNIEERGA